MHTQGEWEVAKINCGADNDEIVTDVNGCLVNIAAVFGESGYSAATADGKDEPSYEVSKDEAEANARLIAAAPALLVALRDLASAEGLPAGYANRKILIQAARDALHKATGE